jgi:hypothetical protein
MQIAALTMATWLKLMIRKIVPNFFFWNTRLICRVSMPQSTGQNAVCHSFPDGGPERAIAIPGWSAVRFFDRLNGWMNCPADQLTV